ncbi:MAG: thioredoxin domain-containing protein, partial [Geminicoccales bacterium]
GRICQGGIYDHLGGGFARYSVDAMWLVPHFEKMLYDNAQLLDLLAGAFAVTRDPLFAARARQTVGWLEREMLIDGVFASSIDADSEGEEGKYYVWQADEIDRLLGPEAQAFRLAYGVTDHGNWEGRTILNRLHQPALLSPDQEARLRAAGDRLLEARRQRVPPGRDDKVLADWNALTIAALARASAVFGEPRWLDLAQQAFETICRNMTSGDRLAHSWRAGRVMDLGFLDDYAQMAAAALSLLEHTGQPEYLRRAEAWVSVLDAEYRDPAQGGYFQVSAEASDVLVRVQTAQDGPTPAGNGTMVSVLARLFCLTGKPAYRQRAEVVFEAFSGEAARNPVVHATLLAGGAMLMRPVQIVLLGDPADPDLAALRHAALEAAVPDGVVLTVPAGSSLPETHPAAGKTEVGGRPTAYVCPGQTCWLPITDADALASALVPDRLRQAA